jgi:predicted ATPase
MLGYVDAALADVERALKDARELGQAIGLAHALVTTALTHIYCGNYATANAQSNEAAILADELGARYWKALGMLHQGYVLTMTDKASDAVHMITTGITEYRSTGSTMYLPFALSFLVIAHAKLGQLEDAWDSIGEALAAIQTTKEKWHEAEVNRIAGEVALKSPQLNAATVEGYFERALAVARQQQAKSWELRAAMSMARLWRDQGKRRQAHELLAPVYGWFTEGFDTRDLMEAKALLSELVA